jgi:hypothetical protein
MIWRRSYSTRIARLDATLLGEGTDLSGALVRAGDFPLILGGWDIKSLNEQRLWLKLFRDLSLPDEQVRLGLVLDQSCAGHAGALGTILPPSLQNLCVLWSDPSGASRELLKPESEARSFAWNPASGLVMVGPATEEAWDEMQATLQ